jgi:hypothetical protein
MTSVPTPEALLPCPNAARFGIPGKCHVCNICDGSGFFKDRRRSPSLSAEEVEAIQGAADDLSKQLGDGAHYVIQLHTILARHGAGKREG